jgi:hypothetical protein
MFLLWWVFWMDIERDFFLNLFGFVRNYADVSDFRLTLLQSFRISKFLSKILGLWGGIDLKTETSD